MIYVFTGSNTFMINERVREITAEFISEYGNLGVEQLDGEEATLDRIREALESLPFLAPKKLVILQSPGANKDFLQDCKNVLSSVNETTDLIIVEPKFDKRSSYYKVAKKLQGFKEFSELDRPALQRWVADYAKKHGATMAAGASAELIDRIGLNQLRLSNEIKKLTSYSEEITKESIDQLTVRTPKSTIFELIDATFSGDKKRAMRLYEEQRELQVDPMQIMAMLTWQFHVLATVKAAGKMTDREIASQAKLNPFVVQKTRRLVGKLSMSKITELVHKLHVLDKKFKSTRINPDEALKTFLLSI